MKNFEKKSQRKYLIVWGLTLAMILGLVSLAACAPKQAEVGGSGSESTAEDPAVDTAPFEFTMLSDCAVCHTIEGATMTDEKCPQAIAHKDQRCIDCHTDSELLTTTHANLTYADKPDKKSTTNTVDPAMCISCHGTMEEMAVITADSQALVDSYKTVVNPHARPAGDTHSESPAPCISCHDNHSEDLNKDAMRYCASCHHRGIFTCGNCHEVREREPIG
jgi:hypothetical protein